MSPRLSVAAEEIAGVDLAVHVLEVGVETVGDYGRRFLLEAAQVVDDAAAEECGAVFKCGFVDYHVDTFRLDQLHDSLDRRLAEVVAV